MHEKEVNEIIDIEEFARAGKPIPVAETYRIRVDRQHYNVSSATTSGRDILSLAGKTPESHKLYQHKKGRQPEQIAPDEEVDLRGSGVERFTTMPKDTTEGLVKPATRRQFNLPAEDEAYLDGLGLCWESINEGGALWLIIYGWVLPPGYTASEVNLGLRIPGSYSDAQIDMVYFHPVLARQDGRSIGGLSTLTIDGVTWQQWSRHRTSAHPWRPGQDDVSSHLCLVDEWLRREFRA